MNHTVSVISLVLYLCHSLAATREQDCLLLVLLFFTTSTTCCLGVLKLFWLNIKEESSSLSCIHQSAGSLTQRSKTFCSFTTIWIVFATHFVLYVCKIHWTVSSNPLHRWLKYLTFQCTRSGSTCVLFAKLYHKQTAVGAHPNHIH